MRLVRLRGIHPSVPGFVVMELIQDAQNAQQVRKALRLVAPLPVVWPSEADCTRVRAGITVELVESF